MTYSPLLSDDLAGYRLWHTIGRKLAFLLERPTYCLRRCTVNPMTDADLRAWWPDLGLVVTELRRLNHTDEAGRLLNAVAAGATSSEILGLVGIVLLHSRALRSELNSQVRASWDRVMTDIDRAYPPTFRFNHWLTELGCNKEVSAKWLIAFALACLLLASSLLYRAF